MVQYEHLVIKIYKCIENVKPDETIKFVYHDYHCNT